MSQSLGKYELLEPIGKGGFGAVYRARDTLLNVSRAVKLLHPALVSDPEFIARFRQEAQIAARLEHPHIVPVYDLGELDGRFFLAMRLMPGGSLKDRLDLEGRLPYAEAVRIITQVAAALDFAFRSPDKLIHRDVKPGNILLEADGAVRLSDFGFAKALEGEGSSSLSASGGLVGTLAYLAPEIWNGQPASPASDQYSLACVFYELITGESLFGSGDSPLPVVMKRHLDPLALPAQWPDGVPVGVSRVLGRALAKTPEARYASAGQFAQALERVDPNLSPDPSPKGKGGMPPSPKGGSPEGRGKGQGVRSAARPLPWKWLGLGAGLLAGLVLLVGVVSLAMQAANDRRAAQTAQARLNLTAQALAALPSFTPDTSPLSPSATPLLPTPTHTSMPPSMTPTPLPPSPSPAYDPGDTQRSPVDGMVLSYIPAGTFLMGMNNGDADERPVHSVSLDAFWMDQTEVTNGMYAAFLNAMGNQTEGGATWLGAAEYGVQIYSSGSQWIVDVGKEDHPVIKVSWYGAAAYCAWTGGQLPTEAEWEYAARGGLAGASYPWGDKYPVCTLGSENGAQFSACPAWDTIAVSSFAPNGYGLYDMAGNVWEWVGDWYGPYSSEAVENPTGPAAGQYRALRGGTSNDYGLNLRVSLRSWRSPGHQDYQGGFRCARSP